MNTELSGLRSKIDSIDTQLLELINQRAGIAKQIGMAKHEGKTQTLLHRPEREAQILTKIINNNIGPLSNESVSLLFREIISQCMALEQKISVAFLGPDGTFSHQASLKAFGSASEFTPVHSIEEVFRRVATGAVQYGVVPVENSTEGSITYTLDSFLQYKCVITGEIELPIHHYLVADKSTNANNISRIYSHSQALNQCAAYLDEYYPNAQRIAILSTAEAARRMKTEWNAAAISSKIASDTYDLQILASKIEDKADNTTRFLIIGQNHVDKSGSDKTSVIISVKNKPGALYNILRSFNNLDIDLTNIESRPSKYGKWSYVFFIDFKGHKDDAKIQHLFNELTEVSIAVQVLGSYPQAV